MCVTVLYKNKSSSTYVPYLDILFSTHVVCGKIIIRQDEMKSDDRDKAKARAYINNSVMRV